MLDMESEISTLRYLIDRIEKAPTPVKQVATLLDLVDEAHRVFCIRYEEVHGKASK